MTAEQFREITGADRPRELANQCVWAGLARPLAEYPFASSIGRRWRFDLAWPDLLVAVEIDGGIWIRGRHSRGKGQLGDMEKLNAAAAMGWRVLRFTPDQVRNGTALNEIQNVVSSVDGGNDGSGSTSGG